MSSIKRRKRSAEELPLGDAIDRLMRVTASILATPAGVINPRLEQEREQLVQALNSISVKMGFECRINLDGETATLLEDAEESAVPTALEIIRQGASTSCCRITKAEALGTSRAPSKKTTNRSRSRSK